MPIHEVEDELRRAGYVTIGVAVGMTKLTRAAIYRWALGNPPKVRTVRRGARLFFHRGDLDKRTAIRANGTP